MKELSLLMLSVQKPKRDNREITANLMQTLKSYKTLEAPELVDESTQLLSDSSYGLSEISKLVVQATISEKTMLTWCEIFPPYLESRAFRRN